MNQMFWRFQYIGAESQTETGTDIPKKNRVERKTKHYASIRSICNICESTTTRSSDNAWANSKGQKQIENRPEKKKQKKERKCQTMSVKTIYLMDENVWLPQTWHMKCL